MRQFLESEAQEIARRIAEELILLKCEAETEGLEMLTFLLDMARIEARLVEFGFGQESVFEKKSIRETAQG